MNNQKLSESVMEISLAKPQLDKNKERKRGGRDGPVGSHGFRGGPPHGGGPGFGGRGRGGMFGPPRGGYGGGFGGGYGGGGYGGSKLIKTCTLTSSEADIQ